ncbi:uncharacterized protein LOC126678374 [Mercurialis annua]|uniref:uncharacterized protein LOC126678374 n=1 Tax=Mercurialis annua TaxID=3986 RepID=UPI0021604E53|nr:uncharacterized protein LOC126678374 [Mercurialis annua]
MEELGFRLGCLPPPLLPQLANPNLETHEKLIVAFCQALALPTGEQLLQRFNITLNCVHCGGVESINHLLFFCRFVQRIWFASPLGLNTLRLQNQPFPLLWRQVTADLLCQDPSQSSLNLCCFICWFIWKQRNSLLFDQVDQCELDMLSIAIAAYSEFAGITQNKSSPHEVGPMVISQLEWRPPPQGFIKINYDASTSRDHHCGFVSSVARTSSGLIIGRFHACFRHIWDPGILEFLALRESLNWAASCSWQSVIVEGDALQVSQVINSCNIVDYRTWEICQDVWRLQSCFVQCIIQYVNRKFNGLAHDLTCRVKKCYIQGL